MEEISPNIQGVRMASSDNGMHELILIAPNAMWADVLLHTLGDRVILSHSYDGTDVTFYLLFELPTIDKLFKVAINAFNETLQWLTWINEKTVTDIRVCYRDGKGGLIFFGAPVGLSN